MKWRVLGKISAFNPPTMDEARKEFYPKWMKSGVLGKISAFNPPLMDGARKEFYPEWMKRMVLGKKRGTFFKSASRPNIIIMKYHYYFEIISSIHSFFCIASIQSAGIPSNP